MERTISYQGGRRNERSIVGLSLDGYRAKLQTNGAYNSGNNMRFGFKNFIPLDDLLASRYWHLPVSPETEINIREIIGALVVQECKNAFMIVRKTLTRTLYQTCNKLNIHHISHNFFIRARRASKARRRFCRRRQAAQILTMPASVPLRWEARQAYGAALFFEQN